ncbi:MAG: pseudouridine synthase [Gammaproteobacteria bacterium]|nr:pseudouridine synthase [Gammaproteobacteria bacterium]
MHAGAKIKSVTERSHRRSAHPDAELAEKLQKVLARGGLGSRRQWESWIEAGRVEVNGKAAHLGQRVTSSDRIRVDGRLFTAGTAPQQPRILAYHKPVGEICARHDPEGRPTVFERLPELAMGRWMSIGRLDFNTCGLLLFSNSGDLVHRLTHPSTGIEREYAVRVVGTASEDALKALSAGVMLDGRLARFTRISAAHGDGVNRWYRVVLEEGRNREVRRLWETQALKVNRLIRVRYADVTLPRSLPPGHWMELEGEVLHQLFAAAGLGEERSLHHQDVKRVSRRRGRRP